MSNNEFYLQHIQNYIDGTSSLQDMEIEDHILECIFVFRPELRPKPKLLFSDIWNKYQLSKKNVQNDIQDLDVKEYHEEDNISLILDNFHITPKLQIDDILSSVQEGPLSTSKKEGEERGQIINFSSEKQSFEDETISKQGNVSKESSITKEQKFSWGIWTSIAIAASTILIVLPTNIWIQQEEIQTAPSFSSGNSIPKQEAKHLEYRENLPENRDEKHFETKESFDETIENEETTETMQFNDFETEKSDRVEETSISLQPSKSVQQLPKSKKRSIPTSQSHTNIPQKKSSHPIEQEDTTVRNNSENDEEMVIDDQQVLSMSPRSQSVISMEQQVFETRRVAEEIIEGATEEIAEETIMDVSRNSISPSDSFEEERVERKQEVFSRGRSKRDVSKEASPSVPALDNLASAPLSPYLNMRIQIQDASGPLELNVSELFFEHVEGRIVPYKDVQQNWVFSVPSNLSGVFVYNGVKSDLLLVKHQYICILTTQKLTCKEP